MSCGGRFSSCSYCVDSPTEVSDLPGQLGRVGEEGHKQPPFSVYQLISLQTLAAALGNTVRFNFLHFTLNFYLEKPWYNSEYIYYLQTTVPLNYSVYTYIPFS